MISADLVASYLTANPRIRVPWAQFGYVPQALIEAAREVDFIVQIIDHELLGHFREAFKATKLHDFLWFARTLVNAGIYEVDNVVAFLGGVLNLFLGISRAQCPWTRPDGPCTCGRERACTCRKERAQVSWKDMVDYFLTAQADNDAYRPPFGQKLIAKQMFELRPEIKRANVTDHFKHHGSMAGTDYWSSLETLVSAEEDTICLWSLSPKLSQLSIKVRIPKMQVEVSPEGNLSCDVDIARVVAVAFDDKRLVTALMTNRLLVTWSMSHRDTKIFAQKWEFQMENPQDNLWYGHHRGNWITTDTAGRLSFWDLQTPIIGPKGQILPNNVLLGHSAKIMAYMEVGENFFITASLDRTIIMWDVRHMSVDTKRDDHQGAVLTMCYLPNFTILVSAGCEKRIYVWGLDSTAFRGLRTKLEGHEHNLVSVCAAAEVFFSLDEGMIIKIWAAASLMLLQTLGGYPLSVHKLLVVPHLGRLVMVGKRFIFYEGNEALMALMGHKQKKEEGDAPAKIEGAKTENAICSGLNDCALVLYNVRSRSVALYPAAGGAPKIHDFQLDRDDAITCATVGGRNKSILVFGTSNGTIQFIKFLSGYSLKTFLGINASPAAAKIEPPEHRGAVKVSTRGLSAGITCITCEETCAFVGTTEGSLLMFRLGEDIELKMVISAGDHVDHADPSVNPITVIEVDGRTNVAIVGTSEGQINVYAMDSLKFLCSINLKAEMRKRESDVTGSLHTIRVVGDRHILCLVDSQWALLVFTVTATNRMSMYLESVERKLGSVDPATAIAVFHCLTIPFITGTVAESELPPVPEGDELLVWSEKDTLNLPSGRTVEGAPEPLPKVDVLAHGLVFCGLQNGDIIVVHILKGGYPVRQHSWNAHENKVDSLSCLNSPPSLVSMDAAYTKVWSTIGELWASVSRTGTEVWPPPQVSGRQLLLLKEAMDAATSLNLDCKRVESRGRGSNSSRITTHRAMGASPSKDELRNERRLNTFVTQTDVTLNENSDEKEEKDDFLPSIQKSVRMPTHRTKEKRIVSAGKMSTLCRHHAFSLFQAGSCAGVIRQDPVEKLARLHPIDRRAFPPINQRLLYGGERKVSGFRKYPSEPTLVERAVRTTDTMRQFVEASYHVDLRTINMKTIHRPAFVSGLDVGRVSPFDNENSASLSAAQSITRRKSQSKATSVLNSI
eukprot:GEMP01004845.1.p1 GENE.GEMP01004845.1~~GEMP01004845.1.p1  ORF type:complete len:1180 (-),score=246.09 GEMP01004845.1:393-3932(-)